MNKDDIVDALRTISSLLNIRGENPFKIKSYDRAADSINMLGDRADEIISSGEFKNINGIGKGISSAIESLLKNDLTPIAEARGDLPETILELLKIQGIGPKKIKVLYENLKIATIGELEYSCNENRLLGILGFGKRTQEKIITSINFLKSQQGKKLLSEGLIISDRILDHLKKHLNHERIEVAGEIRRGMEIISSIEIIHTGKEENARNAFSKLNGFKIKENNKGFIDGIEVVFHSAIKSNFNYLNFYHSSSIKHIKWLEGKFGIIISREGIRKDGNFMAPSSEEEIYSILDIPFIPPEIREGVVEEEWVKNGAKKLLELPDIRELIHIHSIFSDGSATIEELAKRANDMGFQSILISDHSAYANYAGGLTEERLHQQKFEIDRVQNRLPGIRILQGIEADILPDGRLDLKEKSRETLDCVIGSIHSGFSMSKSEMTDRIKKAINDSTIKIFAHPTGRLLLSRSGYEVDMDEILKEAGEKGVAIELNSSPHRLDLDWRNAALVHKYNLKIAIDPDAHSLDGFNDLRYGVMMARKMALSKDNLFKVNN